MSQPPKSLHIETLTVGPFAENTYLVGDPESRDAILIDPGDEAERLWSRVIAGGWNLHLMALTHAHIDHVMALPELRRRTTVPILLHPGEARLYDAVPMQAMMFGVECEPLPAIDRWIGEGELIEAGTLRFRTLMVQGHSPASIAFVADDPAGTVFCGDSIFLGSIGRTDLPGGDHKLLIERIRTQLLTLPDATPLYPGHGPATTVGFERQSNPFLR